jgi:hypothetical protein
VNLAEPVEWADDPGQHPGENRGPGGCAIVFLLLMFAAVAGFAGAAVALLFS